MFFFFRIIDFAVFLRGALYRVVVKLRALCSAAFCVPICGFLGKSEALMRFDIRYRVIIVEILLRC